MRAPRWLVGALLSAGALGSAAACSGDLDLGPSGPGGTRRVPPTPETFVPAPPALHRLTRAEYIATVETLFEGGATIARPDDLPEDSLLHGFSTVGASEVSIPPLDVERYETAARELVAQVLADPGRRMRFFGCDVATEGAPCVRAFLTRFGRRAYRRALTAQELDELAALAADTGALLRDPWVGAGQSVTAILQSPDFLFRVDVGEPDPADASRLRFTSLEMASRLSYFIWGSTPDEALLAAAERGELVTDEGLRREVTRMLADPRARATMERFFGEFMSLERLATVSKDPELYPQFTPTLRASMRREVEMIFGDVWDRDVDVREMLSTDVAFVDTELAAIYGLPDPGPGEFVRTTLPAAQERGGIMGRAGVLAMWAHATLNSPTHRGKFIRTGLLCQDVPPPPPGVTTELSEPPEGVTETLRTRLERHRESPACAGCHELTDPLGFTLEHFDPIGQRRELDQGLPIDASGAVDGLPVDGAAELGAALAESERVGACVARRFYRWAAGHLETRGELPAVAELETSFAASGYRLRELVTLVVLSEAFRTASYPAGECAEGMTRSCDNACGAGTQRCEAGGHWGACSAPAGGTESCNGADDDCDGSVDEGVSRACESACGAGIEMCVSGGFSACSARAPAAESCNHLDDDCDTRLDEGFLPFAYSGTYTELRTHHPVCDGGGQRVGLECNAAIHGVCARGASTCGSSGFGPVENSGDAAFITCVAADVRTTSYAELATHHPECNAGTRIGPTCNAAIHRYCAAAGLTTGYGPVEVSGSVVTVACVPGAMTFNTTYTEVSTHHGGCTTATRIGPDCNAAIHRWCASRGMVSGFGPLENAGDVLVVACVPR